METNNYSGRTAKRSYRRLFAGIAAIALIALGAISCNPEAKWETKDVKLNMKVDNVSAGFIECSFSTDKDAYYLISIVDPWEDYNPVANQKQFMQLALDSAYADYLMWRNGLLREKEFNVAPFSSHSLHYGDTRHFFTGLLPDRDYWVFAFVVDPVTLKPTGNLVLENVKTTDESVMDVHFDYRIRGMWDYIYPLDSTGKVHNRFPYIATTRDSLTLTEDSLFSQEGAVLYFYFWCLERFLEPEKAKVTYGVHAVENDGYQSSEAFEIGHTYYTAICGFDGSFKQMTIYRFVWTGEKCDMYLKDTDPENIANQFR
jgi:hypothetical protein